MLNQMNLQRLSTWQSVFIVIVFKSFLSSKPTDSICGPMSCGQGPNISYPFYIVGTGCENCGYPGFGINCEEHFPVYATSSNRYVIKTISYEDQNFRLFNIELINNNTSCFSPLSNFSFDRSSLVYTPHHADLVYFYNCTESFHVNYTKSLVGCASSDSLKTYVVLIRSDQGLKWSVKECELSVVAPVQLDEWQVNQTVNRFDYGKLLQDGFTLKWSNLIGVHCKVCRKSGGECGFEKNQSVCYCSNGTHRRHCNEGDTKLGVKLGIGIGGPLILLIIISSLFMLWHCYRKKHASPRYVPRNISSRSDLEGGSVYYKVPIFSYSELEKVTGNFDSDKLLGDGGFGTVYYGELPDGREVAVKRLYEHNFRRVEQFMNEIEILTKLQHKNLVALYGCTSRRSRELLLVYEFVPNGTVADNLYGDTVKASSLTWPIRMSIAIETASALAYLHASGIIHRDVKTNNILLDNNFSVKVADFGLSRLFPLDVTHISTAPQGTPGYVDPEYHQCYQLTNKSDVYSFGVVLTELISSMPAVDINRHRHEINLANLAINRIQKCAFNELIDPSLGYESDQEVRRMTTSVAELAFRCLQQDKEMRPAMDEVWEELKRIQTGEYKLDNPDEGHENEVMKSTRPSQSSPEYAEASLLKNNRVPPSPVSVTHKWLSDDTTPNTSAYSPSSA